MQIRRPYICGSAREGLLVKCRFSTNFTISRKLVKSPDDRVCASDPSHLLREPRLIRDTLYTRAHTVEGYARRGNEWVGWNACGTWEEGGTGEGGNLRPSVPAVARFSLFCFTLATGFQPLSWSFRKLRNNLASRSVGVLFFWRAYRVALAIHSGELCSFYLTVIHFFTYRVYVSI